MLHKILIFLLLDWFLLLLSFFDFRSFLFLLILWNFVLYDRRFNLLFNSMKNWFRLIRLQRLILNLSWILRMLRSINNNSWKVGIKRGLVLIIIFHLFPSPCFTYNSFWMKSSNSFLYFIWIFHYLISKIIKSINSFLKFFINMLILFKVFITFNFWLLLFYLFGPFSIFFIDTIKHIELIL